MNKQVLLYEDTKKLPDIFSSLDLKAMIKEIDRSPRYLKNVWGAWMRARDKALFMTLYLLALRPKEACYLRFDDFNSNDKTIKIRGENNKTGKDRILPFPNDLTPYYQNFFSYSRARFWKCCPFLFPSYLNKPISPCTWKGIFREKILKPLGLWLPPENNSKIPRYRTYTLRHTRVTEILNKSNDIFLISNLLGHSKLSSTNVYLHKSKTYIDYMRGIINNDTR